MHAIKDVEELGTELHVRPLAPEICRFNGREIVIVDTFRGQGGVDPRLVAEDVIPRECKARSVEPFIEAAYR